MMKAAQLSEELPQPSNVAAEGALLGGMLIDNKIIDYVADELKPEHFFEPLHAAIYETILQEAAAGRIVSPVSLKPYFETDRTMADLGGVGYLVKLTADGSALIGWRDFKRQIIDLAKLRTLAQAGRRLTEKACDTSQNDLDPKALVNELDEAFATVLSQGTATKSLSFAAAFDTTIEAVKAEARGEGIASFRLEGFDAYNNLFGRIRVGEVTILAGRPGMGKTITGIHVALSAAKANVATCFISLEMPLESVVVRAIADVAADDPMAPNFSDITNGRLQKVDFDVLNEQRQQVARWPLLFTDPTGVTIGRLAMLIRRYKRRFAGEGHDLQMVVVDYLQLIKGDRQTRNRYEEIGQISRTIKEIAKECGVHIVMLSQLSRAVEQREDKRPQLHDLRDSGDIEQDADNVVFVYRHEYYMQKTAPDRGHDKWADWNIEFANCRNRLELLCRKHRQGAESTGHCFFYGSHMAVRDNQLNLEGDLPWGE